MSVLTHLALAHLGNIQSTQFYHCTQNKCDQFTNHLLPRTGRSFPTSLVRQAISMYSEVYSDDLEALNLESIKCHLATVEKLFLCKLNPPRIKWGRIFPFQLGKSIPSDSVASPRREVERSLNSGIHNLSSLELALSMIGSSSYLTSAFQTDSNNLLYTQAR